MPDYAAIKSELADPKYAGLDDKAIASLWLADIPIPVPVIVPAPTTTTLAAVFGASGGVDDIIQEILAARKWGPAKDAGDVKGADAAQAAAEVDAQAAEAVKAP